MYGANKIQPVPAPAADWERQGGDARVSAAAADIMSSAWAGHVKLDDPHVLTPKGERMRKLVLLV